MKMRKVMLFIFFGMVRLISAHHENVQIVQESSNSQLLILVVIIIIVGIAYLFLRLNKMKGGKNEI